MVEAKVRLPFGKDAARSGGKDWRAPEGRTTIEANMENPLPPWSILDLSQLEVP